MELSERLITGLIYGFGSQRRQTQDSPVLPDVWAYFAAPSRDGLPGDVRPGAKPGALELLLTPHRDAGPAALARDLRTRLDAMRGAIEDEKQSRLPARLPARIAYTQSYVVARLYFDEVVLALLPLTPWWRRFVWREMFQDRDEDQRDDRTLGDILSFFDRAHLARLLDTWYRAQMPERFARPGMRGDSLWMKPATRIFLGAEPGDEDCGEETVEIAHDLLWMVSVVGTLEWARRLEAGEAGEEERSNARVDAEGRLDSLPFEDAERRKVDFRPIVDAGCDLLDSGLPVLESRQPSLWLINRNRPAEPALGESRRATKADAATRLFSIRCDGIAWAVLDSGIDARHPAFLRHRRSDEEELPWAKRTRVERTYDFTRLRPLLEVDVARELWNAEDILEQRFDDPELDEQLQPIRQLIHREDQVDEAREEGGAGRWDPSRRRLRAQLEELASRIEKGREIDWELLDPLLEVRHDDDYPVPISGHGTHVAGILGADWPEEKLQGMCTDIRLYDMRVLDPFGPNDEFTVLAALQFIQHLNLQKELPTLHGANISLSIRHDVKNYACGRTPVCDECERLVASGVVVVAAGGNAGYDEDEARTGAGAGYRAISITDPGNADAVITVGATHRSSPHTYGVSFFSSRGPTGDGRAKPDLVAPGEKITSTIPGGGMKRQDGTSMAAPHVSGAAALLMARHEELIGRPQRIKEVLRATATDLGREKHFQGAGMLDVLRALQSV